MFNFLKGKFIGLIGLVLLISSIFCDFCLVNGSEKSLVNDCFLIKYIIFIFILCVIMIFAESPYQMIPGILLLHFWFIAGISVTPKELLPSDYNIGVLMNERQIGSTLFLLGSILILVSSIICLLIHKFPKVSKTDREYLIPYRIKSEMYDIIFDLFFK